MCAKATLRILKYAGLTAAATVGAVKAAFVISPELESQFDTALFANDLRAYSEAVGSLKMAHFAKLRSIKSQDSVLRAKDRIRILEVGSGPGVNVHLYPRKSVLIAVDPQPTFETYLKKEVAKAGLELERYIIGKGEDLGDVPDNSVDAVVTTMVMCHLEDPKKFLSEVKRVLAPGGQYYFWEHVESLDPNFEHGDEIHKHRDDHFVYYLQFLGELAFDWKIHSRGGKMKPGERSVEERLIREAGFEAVTVENFDLTSLSDEELRTKRWFARRLANFMRKHGHIRGVAVKGDVAEASSKRRSNNKSFFC